MFKTNSNSDRVNYSDLLMPPAGYQLERAVGTTYSLDLETLTAVAIALGLREDTDSDLISSPVNALCAFQRISKKIIVFCEAGQIKKPSNTSPLNLLLEKMVVEVKLPRVGKSNFYPAFHPKTWVLEYVNEEGDHKYRFVVLSRNLTFSRNWDVSVAIDSDAETEDFEKTEPIIDFLDFLKKKLRELDKDDSRISLIKKLMNHLKTVSFSVDKPFNDFDILPMGIGKKSYPMTEDALFNEERYTWWFSFHDLVVISPFLSPELIESWNDPDRTLTDTKRTLITRKSELGKLSAAQADNFDIFCLKDDVVDGEEQISDEVTEKQQQDIHAKMFLRRKNSDVDLYLGSMNATSAALHQNVEMVVWLNTYRYRLDGEKFLTEIFCGEPDGKGNPFERVQIPENPEPDETTVKDLLEQRIKRICRLDMHAEVSTEGDRYRVVLNVAEIPLNEDVEVEIAPISSEHFVALSNQVVFSGLDLLHASSFYQLRVSIEKESVTRVIMIPTAGIPEERESAVVNSIVKDRKTFIDYVAFILGEDWWMSHMEQKALTASSFYQDGREYMPAIYEKMLRAALDAPEKLDEIEYLLRMISDTNVVPDEFRTLYETFRNTLAKGGEHHG